MNNQGELIVTGMRGYLLNRPVIVCQCGNIYTPVSMKKRAMRNELKTLGWKYTRKYGYVCNVCIEQGYFDRVKDNNIPVHDEARYKVLYDLTIGIIASEYLQTLFMSDYNEIKDIFSNSLNINIMTSGMKMHSATREQWNKIAIIDLIDNEIEINR